MMRGQPSSTKNRLALRVVCAAIAVTIGGFAAMAQDGVRLSTLPSAQSAAGVKPLAAGRGFNIANVRQASVARPVRRTVAVQRTAALPAPGTSSPQSTIVEHRASGMRLIAAVSLDNLRSVLSPEEQKATAGLLTISDPIEGRQLSRFVGQTTQYVSVEGDSALVGWWHPLDDAWIVSKWQRQNGNWRIVSMGALLGADLGTNPIPTTAVAPFDWARTAEPIRDVLAKQNASGVRNFMVAVQDRTIDAQLGDQERQKRAWRTIRERRAIQESFLVRTSALPGFKDIREIVDTAVSSKAVKSLAIDRRDAQRVNGLPANVRATLRAIMVKQGPSIKTFVVQSPMAPAFIVFVFAKNPAPGAAPMSSGTVKPIAFTAMSLLGEPN